MAMIDPRTPIGKATLRYRGLPTRHLEVVNKNWPPS
ncbi:Uncharacterised protein [Shigella flexneri]|nr:Uncharacterised protein [Shigella flexneri]